MNNPEHLAGHYANFLQDIRQNAALGERECSYSSVKPAQIEEICAYWQAGMFSSSAKSQHHGSIRIIEHGKWNRKEGPSILQAEIEIQGKRKRGSIVISKDAEQWQAQGYNQHPDYEHCILHIVLQAQSKCERIYSLGQREIPQILLARAIWQEILKISPSLDLESTDYADYPLEDLPVEDIQSLLKSAASYRIQKKRLLFHHQARALGNSQCWYEAWAESLGYHSNKSAMRLLARRVPLSELLDDKTEKAEALLFGSAGFIKSQLPADSHVEALQYHRRVWDFWWQDREQYELSESHQIQWQIGQLRPTNHPHRRVAALACTVKKWHEFEGLLKADKIKELSQFVAALSHPYWEQHSQLLSATSLRSYALVGKEKLRAFLINHLLVQDESPLAWDIYLREKERGIPGIIKRSAELLFGNQHQAMQLLPYCYAQQGILQLNNDFASSRKQYPQQLEEWSQ